MASPAHSRGCTSVVEPIGHADTYLKKVIRKQKGSRSQNDSEVTSLLKTSRIQKVQNCCTDFRNNTCKKLSLRSNRSDIFASLSLDADVDLIQNNMIVFLKWPVKLRQVSVLKTSD